MKIIEITEQSSSLTALVRHIKEGVPLCDSIFRYQSEAYFDTFLKAKQLREAGSLPALDWESEEILGTDIGESVEIDGKTVWLDVPYLDESTDTRPCPCCNGGKGKCSHGKTVCGTCKGTGVVPADFETDEFPLDEAEYHGKKVELSKPKRGGDKKFYVYVRDPKSKNIRKVSFGAKSGGGNLSVKLRDPKRRKAFADRHNCSQKTDKTSAGYWACRLPRYAKSLGLSGGGTWW